MLEKVSTVFAPYKSFRPWNACCRTKKVHMASRRDLIARSRYKAVESRHKAADRHYLHCRLRTALSRHPDYSRFPRSVRYDSILQICPETLILMTKRHLGYTTYPSTIAEVLNMFLMHHRMCQIIAARSPGLPKNLQWKLKLYISLMRIIFF